VRAIAIGKAHLIVFQTAQALVGDGALVGVARQVVERLLGPASVCLA
jgi:hypothetical protein